jgi:hypothetical protein
LVGKLCVDQWFATDWYLKIVLNFNDDRHCLLDVEVGDFHRCDSDLIGVGSTKTRKNDYKCFKTQLIFLFLVSVEPILIKSLSQS